MLRCTRQTINFTVISIGTPSGMIQVTLSPARESSNRQEADPICRLQCGAQEADSTFCRRSQLLHSKLMISQSTIILAFNFTEFFVSLFAVLCLNSGLILARQAHHHLSPASTPITRFFNLL
jgi:hypothetical protein